MTETAPRLPSDNSLWPGVVTFFFFQLLTDFVAAVYAFGLLSTDIPPEIIAVVVLLAPIGLVALRRAPGKRGQAVLIGLILLTGVAAPLLDTRGRMLVAGLGAGLALVWLPVWLHERGRTGDADWPLDLGLGAGVGVLVSILIHTLLPVSDFPVRLVVAALGGWGYWRWARQPDRPSPPIEPARASVRSTAGLSLGLIAALTLLYFAFTSPNVIARWTGSDYGLILIPVGLALVGYLLAAPQLSHLPRSALLLWNVAFVAALAMTLLAHHIDFPAEPGRYPLAEPTPPGWAPLALIALCLLHPVILLDISLYSRELIARRPTLRALGGGFTLGALFLLVMIFAQVFTTVYDYIPVVGPMFRDRFWLIFTLLGAVMIAPLFFGSVRWPISPVRPPQRWRVSVAVLSVVGLLAALWVYQSPMSMPDSSGTLRVLTYNIQQGYDAEGQLNYRGQLALIRRAAPDAIGLQESDTNRIAGGNFDLVRYFADELGFHSFYGPKVGAGTFGIALLSRYPIEAPRVVYFYSAGEQTAAIVAYLTVGARRFQVIVTHLGNDGPIVQQQNLLNSIDPGAPVIALGDFNFRPDSEQYRLTRTRLDDAWLLRWPSGIDDQGVDATERIDHIFVSPGVTITQVHYWDSGESDHPALWVEIEP